MVQIYLRYHADICIYNNNTRRLYMYMYSVIHADYIYIYLYIQITTESIYIYRLYKYTDQAGSKI